MCKHLLLIDGKTSATFFWASRANLIEYFAIHNSRVRKTELKIIVNMLESEHCLIYLKIKTNMRLGNIKQCLHARSTLRRPIKGFTGRAGGAAATPASGRYAQLLTIWIH